MHKNLFAVILILFSIQCFAQSKLPLSETDFNTVVADKGWSFYDSQSGVKDILVVKIGKDSTMIGYMNFLEGLYSVTYKTTIKVRDNGFEIITTGKGDEPLVLATGFMESKELMVLTLTQNPVPGIKSMFDKGLTLRLEEVKDPGKKEQED